MLREFRRAFAYFPRYKRDITLGLISIPAARGLDLVLPWLIGHFIDQLTAGTLTRPLWLCFALIAGIAAVKGVAKYAMRFYIVGASRRFEEDLRNDVYAHLLKLSPTWFQSQRTGDLMARLTSDIEGVRMFLGPGAMYMSETLLILPPALIVLAFSDWLLALLVLFPLALIAFAMMHYAEPTHVETNKAQECLSQLSNAAQENFAGVRVVRSFAREPVEVERFDRLSQAYCDQSVRVAEVRGKSWTLMMAAKDLGTLVLVSAGCIRLLFGHITFGEFLVFNWYLALLFWPMVALGWLIGMYQRGKVSMDRLNAIFDTRPTIATPPDAYSPDEVRGRIEFRDLRFAHGDNPILQGVDLAIAPGTVVGITGRTGSGKTTLVHSVLRLVDAPPGAVFVDGVDVTRWDLGALRRSIGFVPQEAFLFADTVKENLLLGRDDGGDGVLGRALRAAHVEQELLALPQGLDSVVGERGVTLSGGQRQRATIARALAKEPKILVFDDCLSAVDAETEAAILKDLAAELRGRTTLLVSHRVAALSLADLVVVLEDGRVVEQGKPAELLARKGPFWRLDQRQRAEAELEAIS